MNTEKAISLLLNKSISLEHAAEVAEMDILDFILLLRDKGISWNEYIEDEFCCRQVTLKNFGDKLEEKGND